MKVVICDSAMRDAIALVNWENPTRQIEPVLLQVGGQLQWCIGADILADRETWGKHLQKLEKAGVMFPEPVDVNTSEASVSETDSEGKLVNPKVRTLRTLEQERIQCFKESIVKTEALTVISQVNDSAVE